MYVWKQHGGATNNIQVKINQDRKRSPSIGLDKVAKGRNLQEMRMSRWRKANTLWMCNMFMLFMIISGSWCSALPNLLLYPLVKCHLNGVFWTLLPFPLDEDTFLLADVLLPLETIISHRTIIAPLSSEVSSLANPPKNPSKHHRSCPRGFGTRVALKF